VKQLTETVKKPTTATRKGKKATPKLDTLVEVAKQAAWNLKKRESGIKIEEPSAKPEKGKPPPPDSRNGNPTSTYSGYFRQGTVGVDSKA